MSQNSLDNEFSLTPEQIVNSIKYLNSAFKAVSAIYRDTQREKNIRTATYVLRNLKTHDIIVDKDVDLTLYHAQQEFAYIMDSIMRGPTVLVANEIKKANDLIDSLSI